MSIRLSHSIAKTLCLHRPRLVAPTTLHLFLPRRLISMTTSTDTGLSTETPASHDQNQPQEAVPSPAYRPRYIDIGINLADPIYRGKYHGTQRHPDDLKGVISRAEEVGCTKLIVTGSSFRSSRDALHLASEFPGTVFATAGIHPCSSAIFNTSHTAHHDEDPSDEHTPACEPDPSRLVPDGDGDGDTIDAAKTDTIITDLAALIDAARTSSAPALLVAFGEFGLDYDRLHYCSRETQRHSFAAQLRLAASLSPQLPLFLHSRAAHQDFVAHLKAAFGQRLERLDRGGVVHSFTGTVGEMRELAGLGLYIGVNGCSLKTAENCAVVKEVELSRLMIETDGPWCEVRPSHEGWKYLIEPKPTSPPPAGPANGEVVAAQGVTEADSQAQKPKKQGKKNQKKEPEVPDRFKVVKKEKWEEGAMVKGRNEPCTIERVAKIIAGIKGVSVEEVCEAAWANTVKVFNAIQIDS